MAHPFCQRQFKITRERLIQLERDMGLEPLECLYTQEDGVEAEGDDGAVATVSATNPRLTPEQIRKGLQSSE